MGCLSKQSRMTRSELVLFSWTRSEIDGSCPFPWRTIILLYSQIRPNISSMPSRHMCTSTYDNQALIPSVCSPVEKWSSCSTKQGTRRISLGRFQFVLCLHLPPHSSPRSPSLAMKAMRRGPLYQRPAKARRRKETRARKQKLRCAKGEEEGSPPRLRSVCSTNLTV